MLQRDETSACTAKIRVLLLGRIKDSRKSCNLRCSLFSPVGQLWITQSVVFTCQTLLKHKYEDNVKGLVFFFLWNIYFLLVLALDSMGIINKLKRYYVAMECADLVAFTFEFATWQIRPFLLTGRPQAAQVLFMNHTRNTIWRWIIRVCMGFSTRYPWRSLKVKMFNKNGLPYSIRVLFAPGVVIWPI